MGQLQTALPHVFSPEVFKQPSLISGWSGAGESPAVQFDPGPSAPRVFGVSLRVSHFLIPHPHLLTTCGLGGVSTAESLHGYSQSDSDPSVHTSAGSRHP